MIKYCFIELTPGCHLRLSFISYHIFFYVSPLVNIKKSFFHHEPSPYSISISLSDTHTHFLTHVHAPRQKCVCCGVYAEWDWHVNLAWSLSFLHMWQIFMHRRDKKRVKGIDKSFRKSYLPPTYTEKHWNFWNWKYKNIQKGKDMEIINHNKTFF